MLLLFDKMGSDLDVTNASFGCDRLAINRLVGKEVTMGCIVNIKGCKETVLDREKDLGILIDQYMGHDARNLYQDILDDHKAEISSLKYEYEQNENDAAIYQDIIDSGRANLDYLIDEIENNDCPDRDYLLRKLRNIHWDMGY